MNRMRLLVVLVLICGLCPGVAQASTRDEGIFLLFLSGMEVGREEFSFTSGGLETKGTITMAGQSLTIRTNLEGRPYSWEEYGLTLTPGTTITGNFKSGKFDVQVGPLRKSYSLTKPYVVLDNNVLAHYQYLLDLVSPEEPSVELQVVVPSLVLSNQDPIIPGELRLGELVLYELNGAEVPLQEHILSLPGGLAMRVFATEANHLVLVEIPMQGAEIVRKEYVGLKKSLGTQQAQTHWIEEEFRVANGSISLAGTLALPLGPGPFPAVLLNSGSGPQDRHGNTPPGYVTDIFTIMVERLTKIGYAVLCYDERGVGESTGDYAAASLRDLLSDVDVLLDYLAQHEQIDESRIGMLGHSEGAYFAPLFADRLGALILLAGASIPLDQIMVEQLDYQEAQPWLSTQEKAMLQEYRPQLEKFLQEAQTGVEVSTVLPLNLQWLREHMALDPVKNLQGVTAPVLIIHGDRDLKVMPYHAEALAKALEEGGNDQVTVHYLEGTTHEFLFFPYENPHFDALDPWRLNPVLFELIVEWLQQSL